MTGMGTSPTDGSSSLVPSRIAVCAKADPHVDPGYWVPADAIDDGTCFVDNCDCTPLVYGRVATLPEPPEGWQYAVIRDDLQIWGCGDGEDGRIRQRMRLKYRHIVAPCLAPLRWENTTDGRDL